MQRHLPARSMARFARSGLTAPGWRLSRLSAPLPAPPPQHRRLCSWRHPRCRAPARGYHRHGAAPGIGRAGALGGAHGSLLRRGWSRGRLHTSALLPELSELPAAPSTAPGATADGVECSVNLAMQLLHMAEAQPGTTLACAAVCLRRVCGVPLFSVSGWGCLHQLRYICGCSRTFRCAS